MGKILKISYAFSNKIENLNFIFLNLTLDTIVDNGL
jgi:hypothetical protein